MNASGGLAVSARADAAVVVGLVEIDDRVVCRFEVGGGPHRGAVGKQAAEAIIRGLELAESLRIPVLGILDTSGAEITEGVASLHAWGRIARALTRVSGVVPIVIVLRGACVSGPALLLGIADVVVMTDEAFAYLSGPGAVREFTGMSVDRDELGGSARHAQSTGVASFVATSYDDALAWAETALGYLPDHALADPPAYTSDDPADRDTAVAAATMPDSTTASYDVRHLISDVVDEASLLEVRAGYAANLVTALARIDGKCLGIVANQPMTRAGTLDIEASRKAARFVSLCDTFNLPIVTFVDTPGFEPGRDLEWRGMIRHGAELVHAYCAATVPRVCVIVRKAFGGAYIVMDSRGIGNDVCLAWPSAEIAVMGSAGAVRILHARHLSELDSDSREHEEVRLAAEYEEAFLNPYRAVERGLVDAVIPPVQTRRNIAAALDSLAAKRGVMAPRKHSNTPL